MPGFNRLELERVYQEAEVNANEIPEDFFHPLPPGVLEEREEEEVDDPPDVEAVPANVGGTWAGRFANVNDLNHGLIYSFVRYQGKAACVINVGKNQCTVCTDHRGRIQDIHKVTLDELDLASPPLGYVNDGYTALYLARLQARQFRQGVDCNNTSLWSEQTEKFVGADPSNIFYDCINGTTFIPYEVALTTLKTGQSAAMTRALAVKKLSDRTFDIRLATNTIGLIRDNSVSLFPVYQGHSLTLRQLSQAGVPV